MLCAISYSSVLAKDKGYESFGVCRKTFFGVIPLARVYL